MQKSDSLTKLYFKRNLFIRHVNYIRRKLYRINAGVPSVPLFIFSNYFGDLKLLILPCTEKND